MNNYTKDEQRELKGWLGSGHSANDNPWYMTDEKGHPMDYSYPRNPSYTVPVFGRGQAVARRRYMVRNEKNNFAALPSNTYSDSESEN